MSRHSSHALGKAIQAVETLFGTVWYDLLKLGIEGQGWRSVEKPYHRLPARAKAVVREPVWKMSTFASGLRARFITDSPTINVKWALAVHSQFDHMPHTGTGGVDLYMRDGRAWRFAGIGRPVGQGPHTATFSLNLPPGRRTEYMLYLPLYSAVESVRVGVVAGSTVERGPQEPAAVRPMCFYGTSITHGGCASRPGMAYPAILGRMLDRPFISMAVDGSACMEREVAALLAELNPSVYILDAVANMSDDMIRERFVPFVSRLRKARSKTPIVLMEWPVARPSPQPLRLRENQRNGECRAAYEKLLKAKVSGLHYVPGLGLLGDDGDGTVDGCHPTDLGFMRMADALAPLLQRLV